MPILILIPSNVFSAMPAPVLLPVLLLLSFFLWPRSINWNIDAFFFNLDSGVIAATFVCPLDVIKTRFQVHGLPKLDVAANSFKGLIFFLKKIKIIDLWNSNRCQNWISSLKICIRVVCLWITEILFEFWSGSLIVSSLEQIFQREGLRGMYRGLAPTVLALLPNWAVSWSLTPQFSSHSEFCFELMFCTSQHLVIAINRSTWVGFPC